MAVIKWCKTYSELLQNILEGMGPCIDIGQQMRLISLVLKSNRM